MAERSGNRGPRLTWDSSFEMYCSLRSLERAALSLLARMRFTRCAGSDASSCGDSPAPPAARRPCDAGDLGVNIDLRGLAWLSTITGAGALMPTLPIASASQPEPCTDGTAYQGLVAGSGWHQRSNTVATGKFRLHTRAGARCCLSDCPPLPSSPPDESSGLVPPAAPVEFALHHTFS